MYVHIFNNKTKYVVNIIDDTLKCIILVGVKIFIWGSTTTTRDQYITFEECLISIG